MTSKINDHVARALARLRSLYQDSTSLRSLLTALIEPVQDIEDDFYDLIVERYLSTAVGAQLDQYGVIVGVPRAGKPDDEYRAAIRAGLGINRAKGTIDALLQAVIELLGDDYSYTLTYEPLYPAHLQLTIITKTTPLTTGVMLLLGQLMPVVVPSGVGWDIIEGTLDGGGPAFQLDTAGAGLDEGQLGRTILVESDTTPF